MSGAKHTPGPWVYWVSSRGFGVSQEQGAPYTRHYSDVGSLNFEAVTGEVRAIQEANARLIASAPELLEALQGLMNNSTRADWPDDLFDAAISAIAKATGVSL